MFDYMYMYMTYNNYLGDVCEPHKLYRIGRNYEEELHYDGKS